MRRRDFFKRILGGLGCGYLFARGRKEVTCQICPNPDWSVTTYRIANIDASKAMPVEDFDEEKLLQVLEKCRG